MKNALSKNSSHGGNEVSGCCRCIKLWCRQCPLAWWRRGVVLLLGAMLLSALLPNAPLARRLLSEDTARHRLLQEKDETLQRSEVILQQHRASLRHPRGALTRDGFPAADVGIAMLTMSRERSLTKKQRYRTESLTESLGALLGLLNDTSLQRTYSLHLCNVDSHPELFQEAEALEDVLPVFKRFQSGVTPSSGSQHETTWEKLKTDYVYCLQQTLSLDVRYVLLVEDDAVAHKDLFPVLEHVLKGVVEASDARPVAYIKLYHPLRLLSFYSLEAERLPELLALSLTLGAVLTCWRGGFWKVLHDDVSATPRREVWGRWGGWAVVVAVVAVSVGRVNLLELRRLSPLLYRVTPTPSCCTPAVLYTRQGARHLTDFLLNVTCTRTHSTDMRMDEFRQKRAENRGLLIQPSLFSHIGLVSGLRGGEISPLIVQ
ncbi:hypothetical protein ACOMHN_022559 [Nucella lapillus]